MCVSPLIVKRKTHNFKYGVTLPVPCGKCPLCVRKKINHWTFRIKKEAELHSSAFFVTLTYDEEHLPKTTSGYPTLNKRDVQLFIKRLRRHEERKGNHNKIRYYLVGEYGSRTFRPHYHAVIFGISSFESIKATWQNGFDYSPEVNTSKYGTKAYGYILKYTAKERKTFKNDERQREFSLCSQGLGKNYLTDAMIKYHNQSLDYSFITLENGVKITMPDYYKRKIYDEPTRARLTVHLHKRNEEVTKRKTQLEIQKSHFNEKIVLRNLDIRNRSTKFDERFEVL